MRFVLTRPKIPDPGESCDSRERKEQTHRRGVRSAKREAGSWVLNQRWVS